jgi:hypothetical protein
VSVSRRVAPPRYGTAHALPTYGATVSADVGQAQAGLIQKVKARYIRPGLDLFHMQLARLPHPTVSLSAACGLFSSQVVLLQHLPDISLAHRSPATGLPSVVYFG